MAERVDFLNEAGYNGIAAWVGNSNQLSEFTTTLNTPAVQSGSFQIFGVYMPLNLDDAEQRGLITKVLQQGQGFNIPIWLALRDSGASEANVLAYIDDVCDEALTYGTNVVLYPHDRHYALSIEDSLLILEKIDKPNLFTSLHLNHELRAGNASRLDEIIEKAVSYIKLASLSGANAPGAYNRGSRDWSDTVQALSESAFDVESFFRSLRKHGYSGPIGYNNWKIPGDPRVHHRETLAIYRGWQGD